MDSVKQVWEKLKVGDRFGRHNGMEIIEMEEGRARTRLIVADCHLNAENITHGAAVFGLADLALAAASNSYGRPAVALNMNISFVKASGIGSVLTATARQDNLTHRTGLYRIVVENEQKETIAVAEGLVFRKGN